MAAPPKKGSREPDTRLILDGPAGRRRASPWLLLAVLITGGLALGYLLGVFSPRSMDEFAVPRTVPAGGPAIASPPALTWTLATDTPPEPFRIRDLAWGDEGFVAVFHRVSLETGELWTSPDGAAWSKAEPPPTDAILSHLAQSPAGLVVATVGPESDDSPRLWVRPRDSSWIEAELPLPGNSDIWQLEDVIAGDFGVALSGRWQQGSETRRGFWVSRNGLTYRVTAPPAPLPRLGHPDRRLRFRTTLPATDGFVVIPLVDVERRFGMWRYARDRGWEQASVGAMLGGGVRLVDAAEFKGQYLAAGQVPGSAAIWLSDDASLWTRAIARPDFTFARLFGGELGWVMLTTGGDRTHWYSEDGSAWAPLLAPDPDVPVLDFTSLVAFSPEAMAVWNPGSAIGRSPPGLWIGRLDRGGA